MKKSVKRFGCLALSAFTAMSVLSSCKGGKGGGGGSGDKAYDTETRAMVFATDALDGNFNPFFATSATDTNIAAMTQVGMLTTDAKGNPKCGMDVPTVVREYKQTMKDGNGDVTQNGEAASKENGGTTEYEFIIKNGMKFSDGQDLTIRDVLFNLYVYLDPYYMGSATIYSTDIVGLKAYRLQDESATDDSEEADDMFAASATQRIMDMLNYLDPDDAQPALTEQVEKDIEKVKELFLEEVTSDWALCAGTQESYKDEYTFTEDWEIYYFNEGIIQVQYTQGKPERDENGKYITSLDVAGNELRANIEEAKNDTANIQAIMQREGCTEEEAKAYAVKEFAINNVYESNIAINSSIADVIRYWQTGSKIREELIAEERSNYYQDRFEENAGEQVVKSVSGITTYKTDKDFSGNDLGAQHDVLKIVINGVDPKAIWNFAFSVAPMHYYSNADAIATTPFGVKFSDKEFFDTVLQAPQKNGLPMGAGVYKASNEKGSSDVTKDNFYRNNWVYFERNTFFETMGDASIHNANIKYLRYKVVGSDKILNALQAGDIDFGEPQATVNNLTEIGKYDYLNSKDYTTNGYGYVGVNPKYVPDIQVRQAIMKAMDTASIVTNYYTESLADVIYRPMSTLSWAYPTGCTEYESIAYTTTKSEIEALVEDAGWRKADANSVYMKEGKPLKITFTIAGETTDHPAYEMFQDAAKFLNSCGFDISVTTDITALKKLATGGLAVWAAAWSSTVDPDLYQVYHKDSKATSIKNWGYDTIFADSDQFGYEQYIIDELSAKIEEGRQTLDEATRKTIYAEALDLIMELAVELPTYQRHDLVVYNNKVIDEKTLNQNPSANEGVYDRLWEVNYN
ncbi:MAG: hypothetical protein IKA57_07380 [Clostridia bacterium]|nr:hypothetical protein [Clostridia bacterium]